MADGPAFSLFTFSKLTLQVIVYFFCVSQVQHFVGSSQQINCSRWEYDTTFPVCAVIALTHHIHFDITSL